MTESLISQAMLAILSDLFDCLQQQPRGVKASRFRASRDDSLDAIDTMVRVGLIEDRNRTYFLTLSGISELASVNSNANKLIYSCSKLFALLQKEYKLDPDRTYEIKEIVDLTNMPEGLIRNTLNHLNQGGIFSSITTDHLERNLSFVLSEQIIRHKSFSDVVAQQRNWLSKSLQASQQFVLPNISLLDIDSPRSETTEIDRKEPAFVQGHCPACGPDRRAEVIAKHEEVWDQRGVSGSQTYAILKCAGCSSIYFQKVTEFSDDMEFGYDENGQTAAIPKPKFSYWPLPVRRKRPLWVENLKDNALRCVLIELYEALNAGHHILVAIGARTALDRAMVLLGAAQNSSFPAKLTDLMDRKIVSDHERQILGVLTDAGNASAHRGWQPNTENLATILDGTETFLHRTLVIGKAAKVMNRKVPKRTRAPRKRS